MPTANKNLEQPARGSNVGVWDVPVNDNTGIIDNSFGGEATVALTNANVTLSAGQYQNVFITFTGTITANIAITFPNVGSFYTVQNRTTGAFTVTLQTTVAGSEAIGCPPYEPFDIMTSAGNVRYRNLGRVGTYENYAGETVPAWITACTIPPYLNCDGTVFSSGTYPVLADMLGTTTLPDARGRSWAALNQGTGRLTAAGGVNGNTFLAGGGAPTVTLATSQIPSHTHGVTDPGHQHTFTGNIAGATFGYIGGANDFGAVFTSAVVTNITIQNAGGGGAHANIQPTLVGGIQMIRAA